MGLGNPVHYARDHHAVAEQDVQAASTPVAIRPEVPCMSARGGSVFLRFLPEAVGSVWLGG